MRISDETVLPDSEHGNFTIGIAAATSAFGVTTDSISYTYYPNGRLWTITYSNGTVVTYVYDPAGNRIFCDHHM
jgi:uncharacterized protein RhaS with RHS repeats